MIWKVGFPKWDSNEEKMERERERERNESELSV